ncbi:MAG TPA: ABATE domain-containing protein [Gammaproteobacteria bacterium]|nr:ABATE domain-containing protein [Gammaproteobacteria bacterium]
MTDAHPDKDWLARIEIVGNHPAVDFVNTVHSRVEEPARDYLATPAHLIDWFRHMNLAGKTDARALYGLPPARGERLLRDARDLRETLYAVFSGYVDGRSATAALNNLNRELETQGRWRSLTPISDGFEWRYRIEPAHPDSLFAPLVFAAAELLRSPDLTRLKACPPPDGCGWLFIDRSRNASRTWCNMRTCGNAAKQRRLRARESRRS